MTRQRLRNADSATVRSPRPWMLLFSALIAAGLLLRSPVFADEQVAVADPDPARFAKGIEAFARWDAKNAWPEGGVLFVGSSSIRMWKTHEAFPDWPVINRGFGGAHISDVNHYFGQVVKPYAPRIIVFYCGDNDIAAGKEPKRVLDDFRKFSDRVHDALPKTQIIYLPIKPSTLRWKFWPKMQEANELIDGLCESNEHLTYVNTTPGMLNEKGEPRAELLLDDGLHMNDAGYKVWNEALANEVGRHAPNDNAHKRSGARLGTTP